MDRLRKLNRIAASGGSLPYVPPSQSLLDLLPQLRTVEGMWRLDAPGLSLAQVCHPASLNFDVQYAIRSYTSTPLTLLMTRSPALVPYLDYLRTPLRVHQERLKRK